VMHDGMQYDLIQGQGQGHEPIFKGYFLKSFLFVVLYFACLLLLCLI